jgi:hypothetical protein
MRFELAMSGEDIGRLTGISRSRTERAIRVERARMLLAYREKPSFLRGRGKTRGNSASNGRWPMASLAALDDRPRPQPTITPEAKAWLASLACDKAKEHGYAHEL